MFEKWFADGTGDSPVPSGDSPDGIAQFKPTGVTFLPPCSRQIRSAGRRPGRAGRPRHPFSRPALAYLTMTRALTASRFKLSAADAEVTRQSFAAPTAVPRATLTTTRMTWFAPGPRLLIV